MSGGTPERYAPITGIRTEKDGTLLAFRLATVDRDKASELVKRLHGQATSSHGGKYAYRRKGLLDEVPHRRLIRGVVIVRTEDAGRVVALLEEMGAEVHVRRVELDTEDRAVLCLRPMTGQSDIAHSSVRVSHEMRAGVDERVEVRFADRAGSKGDLAQAVRLVLHLAIYGCREGSAGGIGSSLKDLRATR